MIKQIFYNDTLTRELEKTGVNETVDRENSFPFSENILLFFLTLSLPNVVKGKFRPDFQISFSNILKNKKVPCVSAGRELSFEWSHHRISSTNPKVTVTFQNSIKHSGSERVNINHRRWVFKSSINRDNLHLSHIAPMYHGVHLHWLGLSHVPPFWQYGTQVAVKKELELGWVTNESQWPQRLVIPLAGTYDLAELGDPRRLTFVFGFLDAYEMLKGDYKNYSVEKVRIFNSTLERVRV